VHCSCSSLLVVRILQGPKSVKISVQGKRIGSNFLTKLINLCCFSLPRASWWVLCSCWCCCHACVISFYSIYLFFNPLIVSSFTQHSICRGHRVRTYSYSCLLQSQIQITEHGRYEYNMYAPSISMRERAQQQLGEPSRSDQRCLSTCSTQCHRIARLTQL
jgi:hypothetical protein